MVIRLQEPISTLAIRTTLLWYMTLKCIIPGRQLKNGNLCCYLLFIEIYKNTHDHLFRLIYMYIYIYIYVYISVITKLMKPTCRKWSLFTRIITGVTLSFSFKYVPSPLVLPFPSLKVQFGFFPIDTEHYNHRCMHYSSDVLAWKTVKWSLSSCFLHRLCGAFSYFVVIMPYMCSFSLYWVNGNLAYVLVPFWPGRQCGCRTHQLENVSAYDRLTWPIVPDLQPESLFLLCIYIYIYILADLFELQAVPNMLPLRKSQEKLWISGNWYGSSIGRFPTATVNTWVPVLAGLFCKQFRWIRALWSPI